MNRFCSQINYYSDFHRKKLQVWTANRLHHSTFQITQFLSSFSSSFSSRNLHISHIFNHTNMHIKEIVVSFDFSRRTVWFQIQTTGESCNISLTHLKFHLSKLILLPGRSLSSEGKTKSQGQITQQIP
ncbi:CLUMA_CG008451, isoform A [Clunio marinus]|uniref:CLUMA_CG008451, isoform A n=1 Tax=Clunio marinus TaxID=568069 RepID=A0A1J1I446_9DIPT|nr:CLUMA_CG008451, isoform A [Clunio marinus]